MSNCFLLISTAPTLDNISEQTEFVLRQLMRKFRKSVDFYRINSHFLKNVNEDSEKIITGKIANSDAVILLENRKSDFITRDFLSMHFHEHYTSGKCIISPVQKKTFSFDGNLTDKTCIPDENIRLSIKAAIDYAHHRKSSVTVCTQSEFSFGDYFVSEIEKLGAIKHINFDHFSIEEFLWQSTGGGLFSDVFLADEKSADIITTQFSSQIMFRDGFARYVGKDYSIYHRIVLPYDEMTNSAFAGILLSCSGAIEHEMNLSSVSAWLCRAVAKASERCLKSTREEFLKELTRAINEQIRVRRV